MVEDSGLCHHYNPTVSKRLSFSSYPGQVCSLIYLLTQPAMLSRVLPSFSFPVGCGWLSRAGIATRRGTAALLENNFLLEVPVPSSGPSGMGGDGLLAAHLLWALSQEGPPQGLGPAFYCIAIWFGELIFSSLFRVSNIH